MLGMKVKEAWANKETGLSPNFWGRAMGWYGMAMVDVLDYLPKDHPGRARLISYIKSYTDAVIKVQDKKTDFGIRFWINHWKRKL
jgi:unsaturated rhamnogalacturonyl hydrolase